MIVYAAINVLVLPDNDSICRKRETCETMRQQQHKPLSISNRLLSGVCLGKPLQFCRSNGSNSSYLHLSWIHRRRVPRPPCLILLLCVCCVCLLIGYRWRVVVRVDIDQLDDKVSVGACRTVYFVNIL